MSLSDRSRLGIYEIVGQIGAGGMGEVYRAKDTKLGRDVAIKTLSASLAADKDRLARFEREAKLLAALNHPHIASVYSLDQHEGTAYLTMELVEGETLEQRLRGGPLPVEEALNVARQIAEALEAAHAKGVVHRDLKPANIMVTPDGVVKVLDFGLAKVFSGDVNEANPLHSPTLSLAMTQRELVLGTAGYMSPEQASGQATDQRADIWALGVVLYEMLTGLPVFKGESVPHLLAAVLQAEPDWSSLPKSLDPRLRHLLQLCLKKNVRQRFHSIADVRIELESVLNEPGPDRPLGRSTLAINPGRSVTVVTSVLAVAAGAAAALAWTLWPAAERRAPFYIVEALDMGIWSRPHISRGGTRIAFSAGDDPDIIYVRDFGQFELETLADTRTNPAATTRYCFSPDGAWIAFADVRGRLRRAPVAGGPGVTVAEMSAGYSGCGWADDDHIYYGNRLGIQRVSATRGGLEQIWAWDLDDGPVTYDLLQVLPEAQKFLIATIRPSIDADRSLKLNVSVVDLGTLETTSLLEDVADSQFVASSSHPGKGHLVFTRDNALFAAPLDLSQLELGPAASIVADGVISGAAISESGTLAYFSSNRLSAASYESLDILDRDGAATALVKAPGSYTEVSLSPDGLRIVSTTSATSDFFREDLWLHDLTGGPPTRLTFSGRNGSVVWMPDGERLIYHNYDISETRAQLIMVQIDGSAPPEVLATFDGVTQFHYLPTSISPDGDVLIGENYGAIWTLLLSDRASPATQQDLSYFMQTPSNFRDARFSPDGQFVTYISDETGSDEVYLAPYPGPGPRVRVSIGGGTEPRWNMAGGELFFLKDSSVMVAEIEVNGTVSVLSVRELFENPSFRSGNGYLPYYDVTPDGDQFVMLRRSRETESNYRIELRVIRNWIDVLNRLAPIE